MKNTIISLMILSIIGYVVLNYQVTQYHYYENVSLAEYNSHRSLSDGSFDADMNFLLRDAFSLSEGTGTVIEYVKLIKKATPNVNDDKIDAFTLFLPFSNLSSGDKKNITPTRGAMVYYLGSRLMVPCYGYPTDGMVSIIEKTEGKLKANISFVVDLITTEGNSCKTINFDEDVTFTKASMADAWHP